MDDPLPPPLSDAVAGNAESVWAMLTEDSGCSVTVVDDQYRIMWANERVLIDYEWHLAIRYPGGSGELLDPIGKRLSEIVAPELGRERESFIRQAIETGRPVVYESHLRGVRQRVVIRAINPQSGGKVAAVIARRLRATERIEDLVPPGATLVTPTLQDLGALNTLSPREIEILRLVGEGYSSSQIARQLHRSVRTVEAHRASIGSKLGLRKGSDLVRVAIRAGLCELPDAPDLLKDHAGDQAPRDLAQRDRGDA